MALEPPPFQEASRCDVCKCSFNTFRRRHHCRCCGRTLCHEHSANQMDLPLFGIHSPVRVCPDCFNGSSQSGKNHPQASPDGIDSVTKTVSKLDIVADRDTKMETTTEHPQAGIVECKCGMPLCICEAPAPAPAPAPTTDPPLLQMKSSSTVVPTPNPKPKKTEIAPKNRGSTSNSKAGSVFNLGQASNNTMNTSDIDYEVNGEGLREAIKTGDTTAVKKLLSEGVDANYCDKQGSSVLHLASLFNRTDIVFTLMEHGANLACKNAQGETPLDCAPATLQYKMRQKIEEGTLPE